MFFRRKKIIITLVAFLVLTLYQLLVTPQQSQKTSLPNHVTPEVQGVETKRVQSQVVRVVDGDTVEVLLDNKKQKIRVIGLDTPETVDPRRPVQCFGKEASEYAHKLLVGQTVFLESDSTQGDKDRYDRLLRYIWIENGAVDFGKQMITKGFAHEYTYDLPYKYQDTYLKAEKQAQNDKVGLWADTACIKGSS